MHYKQIILHKLLQHSLINDIKCLEQQNCTNHMSQLHRTFVNISILLKFFHFLNQAI